MPEISGQFQGFLLTFTLTYVYHVSMNEVNASDFQKNLFHWMRVAAREDVVVNHKTLGQFELKPLKKKNKIKFGGGEGMITTNDKTFEGWSEELTEMFEDYL